MSRYETFVIRLWVDPAAVINHGEIRHSLSGAGRRFVRLEDAITFINAYISKDGEAVLDPAVEATTHVAARD